MQPPTEELSGRSKMGIQRDEQGVVVIDYVAWGNSTRNYCDMLAHLYQACCSARAFRGEVWAAHAGKFHINMR